MATCTVTAFQAASAQRAARPRAVAVRAQQQQQRSGSGATLSRREAGLAALAAVAALSGAAPAQAIFGLGGPSAEDKYKEITGALISEVQSAAQMERGAPNREETLKAVRKDINDWVATYRRDTTYSGRPSYGNTYTAVNALAGHVNAYGPLQPVPKKRLERMLKELSDAEKLLARGR